MDREALPRTSPYRVGGDRPRVAARLRRAFLGRQRRHDRVTRHSEPFLRSVIARRWTAAPDKLERSRARTTWRFTPVRDSLRVGGIALYPIDGVASEGALMAYLPADSLLWASDYVQDTTGPTLYASEVRLAACRVGITPTRGAAEHVPPFAWSTLTALAKLMPLNGSPTIDNCR